MGANGRSDCFICDKHERDNVPGGVIHRDRLVYAGHVLPPRLEGVYLGYVIVDTIRHVPGLGDLTSSEAAAVGTLVNDLAAVLREVEGAEHVYAFVVGDTVPHFHLHLVPRYPGTPPEHHGSRILEWEDARRGGEDGISAVCERVRNGLANHRGEQG